MSIPQTRKQLLDAIDSNYRKLPNDLTNIPLDSTHEKTMEGHAKGSQMSVANLLSYLIGWNQLVLKWCERKSQGQPVDFPETGYKWNEQGRLAQKFYADYSDLDYP